MIDRLVAVVALLSFTGFLVVLLWFVREPDLIVVAILGMVMAAYDFWRELRGGRNGG